MASINYTTANLSLFFRSKTNHPILLYLDIKLDSKIHHWGLRIPFRFSVEIQFVQNTTNNKQEQLTTQKYYSILINIYLTLEHWNKSLFH